MSDEIPKGPQKATKMLPPDPNFSIKQADMNRGGTHNIVHGLYFRDLHEDEKPIADALFEDWRAQYGVDNGIDSAMLMKAVVAFVKSLRGTPKGREGDHNVVDFQNHHARLFKEFVESLGLNRKVRTGGDGNDAIAALAGILKKREPVVVDTTATVNPEGDPR